MMLFILFANVLNLISTRNSHWMLVHQVQERVSETAIPWA